jgi:HD-GYP domain-containing protein (c-di-GMP phosphodiesterase class II)/DNA-binding CsgD family transcriptional regulator
MGPRSARSVCLAELVASLSLATDLGLGQPEEHVLRQTVIADRLAALAGLDDAARRSIFYVSLLAWVGCVSDSHEMAKWFGDDRVLRVDSYEVDKVGLPMIRFMVDHVAAGSGSFRRLSMVGRFLAGGLRDAMNSFVTHCETAGDIADRLGLDSRVRIALGQAFERWDGKGTPAGLKGEAVEAAMRVVQVADEVEVFGRFGGAVSVRDMLQRRRATEFDPVLVDLCCAHAEQLLGDLDDLDAWQVVIDSCPDLSEPIEDDHLVAVLEIFADYADLKSPWFLGHSRAVAELAAAAAAQTGLPARDVDLLGGSALVYRLGVIGVSNGIWDKPGPLTGIERERVRTVPYLTERVLARQPRLAELGLVAGMSQERMDGSGYPRGLSGAAIPMPARILAAADVYRALAEDRPHRAALGSAERQEAMHDEVRAGRLDAVAVRAVLVASGHPTRRRAALVAGLTVRESEVLVLVARGWSNRQIAVHLSVSPRTVGTHVEHAYAKTGINTRGAAAMFAMRHGLLDAGSDDAGAGPPVTPPKIG